MTRKSSASARPVRRTKIDKQVDTVMEGTRVLVAVIAQSMAEADQSLTVPQMRVLTIISRYGPMNLSEVASHLGVHPSNATRICNRLVEIGLVDRKEDPDDRRRLVLSLTAAGSRLWNGLTDRRRQSIELVVRKMAPSERAELAAGMAAMSQAAEAVTDHADSAPAGARARRARLDGHARLL